jgi:hypothetical protein
LNEIINNLNTSDLISILGGLTIVMSALFGFLGAIIKELLVTRFDKAKQKEIEILKSQLSNNNYIINCAIDSMKSTFLASSNLVIDHYQKVWNTMVLIKRDFSPYINLAYTVLTKEEFINVKNITHIYKGILECDYLVESKRIDEITKEVENSRPFISQYAWSIFFVYRALYGRLSFLAYENAKNKKGLYWLDDNRFISQIINMIIPENKFQILIDNQLLALPNIVNYLELEYQNEIQKHLLGKNISEETVSLAIRLGKGSIIDKN